MLAYSKKISTGTANFKPLTEKYVALIRDKCEVENFASKDQFVFIKHKRLPTVYGRDSSDRRF